MFTCPGCSQKLLKHTEPGKGVLWYCPDCEGRTATVPLLRRYVERDAVNRLWQAAREEDGSGYRACPSCNRSMTAVHIPVEDQPVVLDVCKSCQLVWFDKREYDRLPPLPPEPVEPDFSPKAKQALALIEVDRIREQRQHDMDNDFGAVPMEYWKFIPGFIGLPIEYETDRFYSRPLVTWLLCLTTIAISVYVLLHNPEYWINQFGFVPDAPLRLWGLTAFSSFFLHGGFYHIVSNLYFLFVFGDNVEDALGKSRYLQMIAAAAIAGCALHAVAHPDGSTPLIGASGGISGIIAYYAFRFPRANVGLLIRFGFWFRWWRTPAWFMFLFWVIVQLFGAWLQMSGYSHVSFLAHIGGATVGIATWWATRERI